MSEKVNPPIQILSLLFGYIIPCYVFCKGTGGNFYNTFSLESFLAPKEGQKNMQKYKYLTYWTQLLETTEIFLFVILVKKVRTEGNTGHEVMKISDPKAPSLT